MSRRDLIDPESRVPLDALLGFMPGGFNAIPDIVTRRATVAQILASMPVPPNPNVTTEDRTVPGPAGDPDISVRIYRPVGTSATTGTLPGIYYIHGGGMVLGDVAGEDANAARLCEEVGAVVVSVEYRLAIYGGSAGGGLTLGTVLLARDRGGPALAFMMPIYPMIDDTNTSGSSHEITDIGIWDRAGNIEAWAWYLGGKPADQYAAPARATDLSGLPPGFIDVGTVDMFRDEDIAFANRLMQAGVPCELHVNPGSYHASEVFAPDAALSRRIWALRVDALRRALA
ncbi:alpha/beta hydrolase [Kineosporia sp. A_224]|uniref:alpha/beta hydrolase n=1 Tax=Kineosporia sp. A_224 TaxID=1962180 RepID=UPI000B4AC434|nr:alpha/beta hydrolase [Kineosporia sp. A_224]